MTDEQRAAEKVWRDALDAAVTRLGAEGHSAGAEIIASALRSARASALREAAEGLRENAKAAESIDDPQFTCGLLYSAACIDQIAQQAEQEATSED